MVIALVTSFALAAPAKKKKPAATPVQEQISESTGSASIRLWKEDCLAGKQARLIVESKSSKASAIRFEPPATGSHFTEYAACPAGEVSFALESAEAEGAKLKSFSRNLASGSFTTILWRERDGVPSLETVLDAPAETNSSTAELTVRNFAPALVEISVQAGDSLNARMKAPAAFLNVRGLERRRCQIDTVTKDSSGKESKWTTEIDFSTIPKGTLLIYSDPYGRIRPRIVPDGQPPLGTGDTEANTSSGR